MSDSFNNIGDEEERDTGSNDDCEEECADVVDDLCINSD